MKKKNIIILIIVIALVFLLAKSTLFNNEIEVDGNEVILYEFWGRECPYCVNLNRFLKSIDGKYPSLVIKDYETWHNSENNQLFHKMAAGYDVEVRGVPTIFIDDKVISGFSDSIAEDIEAEINRCLVENCENPINKVIE